MLNRNSELVNSTVNAMSIAAKRQALLSLGKVLKVHNVKTKMIGHLNGLDVKAIRELTKKFYDAPKYCSAKQYRKVIEISGYLKDGVVAYTMTAKEAYDYISQNAELAKKSMPVTEYQIKLLSEMKEAVGFADVPEFDYAGWSYAEAYDFIGKYRRAYNEFKWNLPTPAQISLAEKVAGCKWDKSTIYMFTKQNIGAYIEAIQSGDRESTQFGTSFVEWVDKSRQAGNEDPEIVEERKLDGLMVALYNHLNLEYDPNSRPESLEDIKDVVAFCKESTGSVPFKPFATCRLFNDMEIKYLLTIDDDIYNKYF